MPSDPEDTLELHSGAPATGAGVTGPLAGHASPRQDTRERATFDPELLARGGCRGDHRGLWSRVLTVADDASGSLVVQPPAQRSQVGADTLAGGVARCPQAAAGDVRAPPPGRAAAARSVAPQKPRGRGRSRSGAEAGAWPRLRRAARCSPGSGCPGARSRPAALERWYAAGARRGRRLRPGRRRRRGGGGRGERRARGGGHGRAPGGHRRPAATDGQDARRPPGGGAGRGPRARTRA